MPSRPAPIRRIRRWMWIITTIGVWLWRGIRLSKFKWAKWWNDGDFYNKHCSREDSRFKEYTRTGGDRVEYRTVRSDRLRLQHHRRPFHPYLIPSRVHTTYYFPSFFVPFLFSYILHSCCIKARSGCTLFFLDNDDGDRSRNSPVNSPIARRTMATGDHLARGSTKYWSPHATLSIPPAVPTAQTADA